MFHIQKESNKLLQFQKQKHKSNLRNYEANYTLTLKSELESGLDLWRKQVLSIQSQSIRRAEEWVWSELGRRRGKLAEEMRSREQKCLEKRKENEAEEELNALNTKKKLEIINIFSRYKLSKCLILCQILFVCYYTILESLKSY